MSTDTFLKHIPDIFFESLVKTIDPHPHGKMYSLRGLNVIWEGYVALLKSPGQWEGV